MSHRDEQAEQLGAGRCCASGDLIRTRQRRYEAKFRGKVRGSDGDATLAFDEQINGESGLIFMLGTEA